MKKHKCNKSNQCDGIVSNNKKCPHHGEHDFIHNPTGRPHWRVTCVKADHCLKQYKDAVCEEIQD